MRILITAFRAFGGRPNNTSEDVLNALQSLGIDCGGVIAFYAVLPVNFRTAWPALRKAIAAARPQALLMLGEKCSSGISIETNAKNRRRHAQGQIRLEKSGPLRLFTKFDAYALSCVIPNKSAACKKFWKISHNAGDYLCNFIYWKALAHAPELPAVFIHVPALPAENSKKKIAQMARQIKMLINAMQIQCEDNFEALSAQKQLTVPGQKAGRAKRKKGA